LTSIKNGRGTRGHSGASPNEPQPLNPMISITVAHVACGALVFATTIVLTLRTFRVLPASEAAMEMAARPQES